MVLLSQNEQLFLLTALLCVDFSTAMNIRWPSEKSVLMDKIFAFPGFSYTILLLLTTENIEVRSYGKNSLHQ